MLNPLQPFFHIFSRDINDLYIMHAVRVFALSLVAIFIPIYLLKLDFSWPLIGLFIFLHYFFANFCSYFAFKLASKVGLKKSFILSIPLKIVFLFILEFLPSLSLLISNFWSVIILSFSLALADSIYWMAYHVEFVRFSTEKKSMVQLGRGQVLAATAHMLAPLIGALLIVNLSFTTTFVVIGCLLLLGMIPILFTQDDFEEFEFHLANLKHKNAKAYFFEGMYSPGTSAFWPLLIYVLFTSITTAGIFYTISNVAYVLVTYFVSHQINLANQVKIMFMGSLLHGSSVMVRAFVSTIGGSLIAQTFGGLTGPMFNIPFHSFFYTQAKHSSKAGHIYLREFYLNLGRCTTCLLFIGLLFVIPSTMALQITLFIAGFSLLGINLIRK